MSYNYHPVRQDNRKSRNFLSTTLSAGTALAGMALASPAAVAQTVDPTTAEGFGTLPSVVIASTTVRLRGITEHLDEARACHQARESAQHRDQCDVSKYVSRSTRSAQAGGASAQAVAGPSSMVWMHFYGGKANMDMGGGKFNILGADIGFDHWVADNVMLGLTGGIARDQFTGLSDLSTGEIEYFHIGGHAAITFSKVYVNGMVDFGSADFTTSRPTTTGTAMGAFDGKTISLMNEVGHNGHIGNVNFQPFVSYQYINIQRDAFTETGGGAQNLMVNEDTIESAQISVGFRADTQIDTGGISIRPQVRARFIHEFGEAGDPRMTGVNLATGGTQPGFVPITDAAGFDNAGLVGLGLDISSGGAIHIIIDVDYLFTNEYDMWHGSGRLLWVF